MSDHATYEQECLVQIREQLARVTGGVSDPQELRDVRLEGHFPDTRIVVQLWDPRYDREVTRSYALWSEPTFQHPDGVRESPYSVGMLITTWSLGG